MKEDDRGRKRITGQKKGLKRKSGEDRKKNEEGNRKQIFASELSATTMNYK